MLKISRKTRSLRFVRFYDADYTPRDLCGYFWTVVGALFLSVLLFLSLPLWPVGILASRGANILGYVGEERGRDKEFDWSFRRNGARQGIWWAFGFSIALWLALGLYILGRYLVWSGRAWVAPLVILGIFAGAMVLTGLMRTPKPYPPRKATKATPKPKQPNLMFEFVRAKKRRICPLIKVVDD